MVSKRCCRRSWLWIVPSVFWLLQITQAQQRISERKCHEYIEFVTDSSLGGTLSLIPTIQEFTTANCSTSVDLIIGGQEALIGEFPHQALLGYPKKNNPDELEFLCGGSLISSRYVLTAAHCRKPKIVRLGEHDLDDDDIDHQDFEVANVIKHKEYTLSSSYHDIALVELAEEVEFSDRIRPACLWTNTHLNMSSVVATGFGRANNSLGTLSSKLMKVGLNIMDRTRCQTKFENHRKLKRGVIPQQLCVGSQEGGKDTCQGDSGGPLQVATDIETCVYYIVGITTAGAFECGIGNSEALYTQVASYVDWIEQVVWPDDYFDWTDRNLNPKMTKTEDNDFIIHFPKD